MTRTWLDLRARLLGLLAAIRGTAPGTSLILDSGGMTDELAAEAGNFGVRVALEKPVSGERLIEAVRAARDLTEEGPANPSSQPEDP